MSDTDTSDIEQLQRAIHDIEAARDLQGENYPAKVHLATARNKIRSVIDRNESRTT